MNDIIIHISDLHITEHEGKFGSVYANTYLNTDTKNHDLFYSFIDSIVKKIKDYPCKNRYFIITGDITNIAEEVEFNLAIKFIKKIITDLDISQSNILLIPGDHDIHRDSVKQALRKPENDKANGYDLNEVKFQNFQKLYSEIKGKLFNFENLVFDNLVIEDILILGVNSNFYVGQKESNGYLPIEQIDTEISKFTSEYQNKHLIIAFHHNISGTYEDKQSGQWILENRKNLIPIFQKHNVKCILHGNEHTPKSLKLISSDIFASDAGALTGKEPKGSFKIYEIIKDEKAIKIKNNIFELRKINAVTETHFGDWITISPYEVTNEIEYFEILNNKTEDITEPIEIPSFESTIEAQIDVESISNEVDRVYYINEENQNKLYTIVKEKKLFHSGHFHWSETSRAHNWIDISKLLENKEDLYFVKNSIIDVIETFNLYEGCDLLIGLGYEGNIISSKASIKYNIPYTSLPYSYRYNDHHDYEKRLNYDNVDGRFKKIIIITDVVNDGRTIRKLIAKREDEFFKKVDKVIVVSLFYTGHKEVDTNILNYNMLPPIYDYENDNEVNNIEFYTIKSLRVEKCPYGKNYRDKCFIYKDELSCIHLFYDQK